MDTHIYTHTFEINKRKRLRFHFSSKQYSHVIYNEEFLQSEWDEERVGLPSCNLFLRQKDNCAL